ncbi:CD83 antigen [Xyrichtys novacula]|uniref:CD83 antigen n=1 Tax=Xyrichtys novacula TaxID=13765 RepID=A0AAV1FPK9_XYRNO|nr:CD83 antigen [Xyrichtys novacula]
MISDFLHVVLLSLCVCHAPGSPVTEDTAEVKTVLGGDLTLRCPATFKPGVEYLGISWYKAIDAASTRLNGILTRDLPNGTTQWYVDVEREVNLLGDSPDIFLPNITCADGGVYTCYLAAPLGEQNREKKVILTVSGCPDEATETLITDVYLVVIAALLLLFSFLLFRISYVCLRNTLKEKQEKQEKPKKEILLDSGLKPLDKKDLMLIYTLGPKASKTSTICV